jgi:hypothetical protein
VTTCTWLHSRISLKVHFGGSAQMSSCCFFLGSGSRHTISNRFCPGWMSTTTRSRWRRYSDNGNILPSILDKVVSPQHLKAFMQLYRRLDRCLTCSSRVALPSIPALPLTRRHRSGAHNVSDSWAGINATGCWPGRIRTAELTSCQPSPGLGQSALWNQ